MFHEHSSHLPVAKLEKSPEKPEGTVDVTVLKSHQIDPNIEINKKKKETLVLDCLLFLMKEKIKHSKFKEKIQIFTNCKQESKLLSFFLVLVLYVCLYAHHQNAILLEGAV